MACIRVSFCTSRCLTSTLSTATSSRTRRPSRRRQHWRQPRTSPGRVSRRLDPPLEQVQALRRSASVWLSLRSFPNMRCSRRQMRSDDSTCADQLRRAAFWTPRQIPLRSALPERPLRSVLARRATHRSRQGARARSLAARPRACFHPRACSQERRVHVFQKYTGFIKRPHLLRAAVVLAAAVTTLGVSGGSALAHSYPQTTDPQSSARLDSSPAHIGITYDSPIAASGSSMLLLDSTGAAVPSVADQTDGNRQTSIQPVTDLAPGPYTVDWTSVSADDGHMAQGFYTFVVNGGPGGIIAGQAQSQTQAADLTPTLTVTGAGDGSSVLRVDLDNPTGVERVRIRLSRPDLGEALLTTA